MKCRNGIFLAGVLAASLAHADASFNEVAAVIFGAPPPARSEVEQQEQAVYAQKQLPHYEVTVRNFFGQNGENLLRQDAERTLRDSADFYPRLEKRVHANGICFAGRWRVTEATPYSGYFRQGSEALFIARASTALSRTERGRPRTFGFAGKLFPTLDPAQPVRTDNFFLIDVLAGAQRDHYLDVGMTNQPPIGFRFGVLWLGLQVFSAFSSADRNPGYRPVSALAAHDLDPGQVPAAPRYLMLRAAAEVPRNDSADFRDELDLERNHLKALTFEILVSDTSADKRSPDWRRIGRIELDRSRVSYGCDRQLHFAHPHAGE